MKKYYYDLHIHSCLSPCGDDDSTPNSIAGMGELNGLQIMALTDHNTVIQDDDLIRKARFETNVQIYRKIIAISINDENDNTAQDRIAAAKVADNLLTVDGVLASFALCKIDDTVRISARSTGKINVQIILEKIGGGGHYDAAATVIHGSINDAKIQLTNAIDSYLDEQ